MKSKKSNSTKSQFDRIKLDEISLLAVLCNASVCDNRSQRTVG